MSRVRVLVGATITSLVVVACNALSGVGDLEISTDDASAPRGDGSVGDGDGGLNGGDGSSVSDGQVPVDTGPPPTCPSAGHSCAKAPPSGWDGPFMLFVGDQKDAPGCPTEMPIVDDGPTGDATGAFTCECKCGGVTGAACTAFLDEFSDGACATSAGREDLASCRSPGNAGGSFKASVDLTATGSCPSSAAFKAKADPAFSAMIRLCHRPSQFLPDGCNAGELCVPDPVAPFKTKTCIGNSDPTQACPAPWTDSYRLYGGVNDTRACNLGTCHCEGPTGTACTGGKLKYATSSTTCNGPGPALSIPVTNCVTAGPTTSQRLETAPTPTGGSCAPEGDPAPAGNVTGNGGGIVCCTP